MLTTMRSNRPVAENGGVRHGRGSTGGLSVPDGASSSTIYKKKESKRSSTRASAVPAPTTNLFTRMSSTGAKSLGSAQASRPAPVICGGTLTNAVLRARVTRPRDKIRIN
eukprot:6035213-Prymnesium_polylepis.2